MIHHLCKCSCPFPFQVSGHAQVSAKYWDTPTAAGAHQPADQTQAWPVDHTCQHSQRLPRFPEMPGGKTFIRPLSLKPMVCRACMKRSNTRSSITFWLVHPHQLGYRRQTKYQSLSTQTLKRTQTVSQTVIKGI